MSNRLILFLASLLFSNLILAQNISSSSIWSEKQTKSISPAGKKLITPNVFKTLELDEDAMHSLLSSAPKEGVKNTTTSQTILPIPLSDGTMEEFRIVEYDMMEQELQTQYPEFKTYYGRGVKDPLKRVRLSWTTAGFRAMISTPQGKAFIDPFSQNDTKHYVSYFKKDYPQPEVAFQCGTEGQEVKLTDEYSLLEKSGDCQFRTYRTAVAVTGEYSNHFGVTEAANGGEATILAEVMASINRVNEVYEVDFSIRLILTANTTQVFYYDSTTDPYTNTDSNAMLEENKTNMTATIGDASFDIGHVYGTGNGGVAQLRSPCTANKARGMTGRGTPTNDPFWIDYVAHEIGHQFGGNHTQNNDCNRSTKSYEPGSASTIMGYAGICSPNVQNNSDAYFHSASIEEVGLFVTGSTGNGCATTIANPNTAPTVDAGNNYTIPASTPFVLTATGTDAENDPMTYCWEQFDNEAATMPPVSTNTGGPAFRSLFPTTSNQRYFPKLATVIANGTDTWEVLPSVTRTMNFRVLVRDNSTNATSCTGEDDMLVNVAGAAGPFLVTAPTNTSVVWLEGETKTVTWDVAGTTANGINCANVDISLSTDGGLTYPISLATNVTNDGSESIVVPVGTTTTARVRVMCSDNIFYDISNNNFEIQAGSQSFTMEVVPPNVSLCSGEDAGYTVNTNAVGGFTGSVSLSAANVPSGANLVFGSNSIMAGGSTSITISNTSAVTAGTYVIDIMANGASVTRNSSITLIVNDVPNGVSLNTPADGMTGASTSPTLSWTAINNVTSYRVQIALDAGFGNIVFDQNSMTNSITETGLDPNTMYYWRVKSMEPCEGTWSMARNFITENCISTIESTPVTLSDMGTPTVVSTYNVSQTGTVQSLTVNNILGTHSWISDLTMTLISPDGAISVVLFSGLCGSNDDFNIGFDDAAAAAVATACNPSLNNGDTFIPANPLSVFNGTNANGNWTLQIFDGVNQDGGQLDSWSLNICIEDAQEPLPVEWLSFSATAQKDDILLEWATAEELNNAGFEIERRAEHEREFTYIGKVDASAISSDINNYSFVDADVKTGVVYYYRIRQYDLDGFSYLSEIESAKLEDRDNNFSIYPNPVRETIFGLVNIENASETQVRLYDVQGKLLKSLTVEANEFNLSVAELPSGFYFLEMQTGTINQIEKVVVE